MTELRFDGRVAVVTGAGAGLGRCYALLLASRGAKVVVNDLGGGRHGDGSSSNAADAVVDEIKRNGGVAVADYNSVVEGQKIINTALDHFGRVDVLINNAGILRDRSLIKMTEQDWDLIHDVHLKGSFKTTLAAFPVFKKQGYGRIVMTSSNSGLYGNFGQANYSAAKLGLIGLMNTVAIEGKRGNIYCNVIVPTAASRLTEDILPPDLFAELKPELIAPVVAYLCHESCAENGSIIESAAGWAGKCHIVRSNGSVLRSSVADGVTIEGVRDKWDSITSMRGAKHFDTIQEVSLSLVDALDALKSPNASNSAEDLHEFSFTNRDLIIYALGVGTSVAKPEELRFLYENHEDFKALPSFYVVPALDGVYKTSSENAIPGKSLSLDQILHGEQYLEIIADAPIEGQLTSKVELVEVLDKSSGAVLVYDAASYNERGEQVVRNQLVTFARGAGNFGGPRTGTKIIPCVSKPARKPDLILSQSTTVDQAALYRLSGDSNPLHIDPSLAVMTGFDRPILHGLCTLGFSLRLILGAFASYDPALFKALKVRFVKPVLPGETLEVRTWQEGTRILFETVVVERNVTVISGAYVDLKSVKMQPAADKTPESTSNLQSDAVFENIQERVKADPKKVKNVNAVFLYNITKDGKQVKQWTMDLVNAIVYSGPPKEGKPNTTLTVADEDFIQMALGKLNPQVAFMKGKLKVAGNVMLAQKLAPLLKTEAKL